MTTRIQRVSLLTVIAATTFGLVAGCQGLDDPLAAGGSGAGQGGLSLGLTSSDDSRGAGDGRSEVLRFADDGGLTYTLTHARAYIRDIELDLPRGMRCADVADQLAGGAVCKHGGAGSLDDDGTPDQGRGDFKRRSGSEPDDTFDPNDDDGTPDQGSGDAPGTPGADDTFDPNDDDGTPDQGSGDAPGTPGAGDDDLDRTILIRGPFVVDLMTGETTPSLAGLRIPELAYSRIDVRLHEGRLGNGVLTSGDELVGRSLVVRADFVYMDTPVELVLSLKFSEDVRFEAPGGVPAGPGVALELDASRWLAGVRLGDCLDDGDLVVENGVLLVDEDSDSSCSDVENTIRTNIKRSGQVRN
jgi:hypothetical protein